MNKGKVQGKACVKAWARAGVWSQLEGRGGSKNKGAGGRQVAIRNGHGEGTWEENIGSPVIRRAGGGLGAGKGKGRKVRHRQRRWGM